MQARVRLSLIVAGTIALAVIAAIAMFGIGRGTVSSAGFEGAIRPPHIAPAPFDLPDQDGRMVRLADMRGRPVVVTFLYTHCTNTCPVTTAQIRGALDQLGHDVPVIAVSVDPRNDTSLAAKQFDTRQHMTGRMRWVMGSEAQLQRIWRVFGVQPQSTGADHSASTVVLDGTGRQRIGFQTDQLTPEGLAHDIRMLEGTPAQGA